MARFDDNNEYEHGSIPATGVLVVNLGTPDEPTAAAVRRYLAEFLWDPRLVEVPRPLWWLVLHGIILRTRPSRVAGKYASIWLKHGAPLLVHSQAIADALQASLDSRSEVPVIVRLGMRYGNPSIRSALEKLRAANVQRLLVLPLYPQYSATTTASTFDAVAGVLRKWRWIPEFRMINHYHDDAGYISAIADSIRHHWQEHGRGEKLLMSFHGLPRRNLMKGDPYHCECQKSARLIAENLQLTEDQWQICFQSRFGAQEWLKPYTDETLKSLAGEGVARVDIVCPGFPADCLETLEEIAIENREVFSQAGGKQYHYIAGLNDGGGHISALADLVTRHLQGWCEDAAGMSAEAAMASRQRALAKGASR